LPFSAAIIQIIYTVTFPLSKYRVFTNTWQHRRVLVEVPSE